MKYWRAYLHFYRSQFTAGLALFLLCWLFLNIVWAIVLFMLLGGLVGFWSFQSFYRSQLTFYHNLGITNWRLIESASLLNIIVVLMFTLAVMLIKTLFA